MVSAVRRKPHLFNYTFQASEKVNTESDAIAYGRIAAALNWGLTRLEDEVEPVFHEVATLAYERRMVQKHGAPF